MGNSINRGPISDPRAYFAADLPTFVVQTKFGNAGLIGDGKCMKSYLMRADGVPVIVKVYIKSPDEDLSYIITKLNAIWMTLNPANYPNILPHQLWVRSISKKTGSHPVYLIRQHINSNLHDRALTRPLLTSMEKLWLVFQLLKCIELCHANGIVHGDVKPENVLCTSWNYLILTDFAFYKPTLIPDDDPADFQYYFDTMGRRSCYVAPERFVRKDKHASCAPSDSGNESSKQSVALSPWMDIFSLGCTIAEMYLDCKVSLLDLPGMHAYLRLAGRSKPNRESVMAMGTYFSSLLSTDEDCPPALGKQKIQQEGPPLNLLDHDKSPAKKSLSRIDEPLLRDVILHMTQRDPEYRYDATKYIAILSGKCNGHQSDGQHEACSPSEAVFPSFFATTLLPLFTLMNGHGINPDDRIALLCSNFTQLFESIAGVADNASKVFFSSLFKDSRRSTGNDHSSCADNSLESSAKRYYYKMATLRPNNNGEFSESMMLSSSSSNRDTAGSPRTPRTEPSTSVSDRDIDDLFEQCNAYINAVESESTYLSEEKDADGNTHVASSPPQLFDTADTSFSASTLPSGQRQQLDGLVIILRVVASTFRHLHTQASKVSSLMLLLRLGLHCSDDAILEHVLPVFVCAFEDQSASVRALAVRSLRTHLSLVKTFTFSEANIYKLYIFPALSKLVRDPDVIVRLALAESVGSIAVSSKQFINAAIVQSQSEEQSRWSSKRVLADSDEKRGRENPHVQISDPLNIGVPVGTSIFTESGYSCISQLEDFHTRVYEWIKALTSDAHESRHVCESSNESSLIRRMLLSDVSRLCAFFGEEKTILLLLPHLLTFFSSKDWELRCTFWTHIASVCAFLGPIVTENYVLPMVEMALNDPSRRVVVATIRFFQTLCELGLVSRKVILSHLSITTALMIHPSVPIRAAAQQLANSCMLMFGTPDAVAQVLPVLAPVLKVQYTAIATESVVSVKGPLDAGSQLDSTTAVVMEIVSAMVDDMSMHIAGENTADEGTDSVEGSRGDECETNYGQSEEKVDKVASVCDIDMAPMETTLSSDVSAPIPAATTCTATTTSAAMPSVVMEVPHLIFMDPLDYPEYLRKYPKSRQVRDKYVNGTGAPSSSANSTAEASTTANLPMSYSLEKALESRNTLLAPTTLSREMLLSPPAMYAHAEHVQTVTIPHQKCDSIFRAIFSEQDAGKFNRSDVRSSHFGLVVESSTTVGSMGRQPFFDPRASSKSIRRCVAALEIPPLPPNTGSLIHPTLSDAPKPEYRYFNYYSETLDKSCAGDRADQSGQRPQKYPKENILVCSLDEHSKTVNRLAVCPDSSFFCSASDDCTVKIWQLRGIDKIARPASTMTIRHSSAVRDICMLENSHSIATACGQMLNVYRIDAADLSRPRPDDLGIDSTPGISISSTPCQLKHLETDGQIVGLQHFNGSVASMLLYVTSCGGLTGMDLRASNACLHTFISPQLGAPTCMTVSPDRNWVCVGTSRGYIQLTDLRYNKTCMIWQHSGGSIHRLACCKSFIGSEKDGTVVPYTADLFVAAGKAEVSMWSLPNGGDCLRCFRSLPLSATREALLPLPVLSAISVPRRSGSITPVYEHRNINYTDPVVLSVIGRTPTHILTAGTDRQIRYWDMNSPSKCFTVAGLEPGQPKTTYENPALSGSSGKLFVSYDASLPSSELSLDSHTPTRDNMGPFHSASAFKGAVTDLKLAELPIKMLLSASADGKVKLWR